MLRDTGKELDLLVNRKVRVIKFAIIVVVLLAIVSTVFIKGYTSAKEKYENYIEALKEENKRLSDPIVQYEVASKDVSIEQIESKILDIGELATVEYLYTDAGKFEDSAVMFGKEIPFSFTTKSFILKWDGVIKAGVEIDKVIVELNESNKEIIIHIPKAKILSHEIDDDSIETLDERNGWFNSIKIEDIREFDAISKDAMEQRAIENGLLDKAFENARDILYRIINTGVVEELEYTITFKMIEE
ncbi:MAG: DUF4230 domain-containing protein [Lachnospiraceae bacterium]|nr:DUF4230 domain-containing protein [Lachnospiraceae bacterium]